MSDIEKKTVLVVDDEPDIQLYLKTVLEDSGFDIILANNGREALTRMFEKKPDIISLDLIMPKMLGIKFFKYIRKHEKFHDIPVVIVTAHAKDELGKKDLEKIQKMSKDSPVPYLEKPINPTEYIKTIKKVLGLSLDDDEFDEKSSLKAQISDKMRKADKDKLQEALRILS
jgi:CheY-like chemotaxis protein